MNTHNGEDGKPNQYAAGMMWRRNPVNGQIEFLTVRHIQQGKNRSVRRFPGLRNRISRTPPVYRDEAPERTLLESWKTLTGQTLGSADKFPASYASGGGYKDYFYLLDEGDIKIDGERTDDLVMNLSHLGKETVCVPEWMPAEELRRGGDNELNHNHARALVVALVAIERKLVREQVAQSGTT